MNRPVALIVAVALLVATHIYGAAEPIELIRAGNLGVSPLLPSAVLLATYLVLFALVVLVWRGKDWARLLCAVLAILALLTSAPHLAAFGALAIGWFAAKALAVVLFYVPPTNRWFRSARPNNSSKPTPLRGAA